MGEAAAKVESIFLYPIKSCKGISVSEAYVSSTGENLLVHIIHPISRLSSSVTFYNYLHDLPLPENENLGLVNYGSLSKSFDTKLIEFQSFTGGIQGFKWDRQWVVVNSKGRACTQRVDPKLCLVEVELSKDAFSVDWKPNKSSHLVIRAPGMDELKVSLCRPPESQTCDGVSVWEWSGSGLDEGDEASKWFTDYLGKPSRLVRFNQESETRPVDPDYAPGFNVMFSDGYPYLLVSQGSLNSLNEIVKEPVPINRFRPNIVVDGCEPFSEDLWKGIKIENLTFHGVKLCARCKIPTINQENAVVGGEPTETLVKFRSGKVLCPDRKGQGKVYFGQNMVCADVHVENEKIIKVGDPVYIIEMLSSYDGTST